MANSSDDPMVAGVAVVGLAGRFPGADSVEELWENLKAGRESIQVFGPEELAASGIPPELIDDPDYVGARGLLREPERFDAAFFGIAPREAELMDPQHRLFLETCWHALEDAGYAPAQVDGRVGVWGGMSTGMTNDTYLHANLGGPRGVPDEDVLPALLGNENDYLTTRVSYKLDLRGPSVNVQTACSTSLMAVVQAFQSLMTYGCDMALAGGVSVSYPQKGGYLYQEGGIASPDGHCRPFDEEAAGTVFSNGVGVVVLKRLEDALDDGDTILATIRGAASNNDGAAKVSFGAPSVEGQAEVIATAQAIADVDPSTITYVETHGTGTPLGDPIEVEGLTRAFRRSTDETEFCALGSIKSNFGHLDSAAGVAGFIKAVLCLRHRTLVPTVHFRTPSSRIEWDASPFFVNAETRPWTRDRGPLRAGVSAFGIGGTNAHVILEEAPELPTPAAEGAPCLLPLSARSPEALREAGRRLAGRLGGSPAPHLLDVAHTLQVGREAFRHRAALVATDLDEARDILGTQDTRLLTGDALDGVDGIVFLFPGGGSQYLEMGRDLYATLPDFRRDIDAGLGAMKEREGIDLRPLWFRPEDREAAESAFQRPSIQLPAIFILEMALARQLMRWGFEPTALIGHSMGENTAACLAGVLSYADGLGLAALRGRLFDTAAPGGMLSVTASREALAPHLGPGLDLAAVNGPEQCTVSGPTAALDALAASLEAAGIDAQIVPIDIAAHSALVDPLLEPFEAYLRGVELRPPTIPFLSNRTGTWITDDEATDPAYWAAHLRGTVRFADDVRTVLDAGRPFFFEVGPGRILSSLVKLADPSVAPRVTPVTRHPKDVSGDLEALLAAVGRAWVAGVEVDWDCIRGGASPRRISLPGYPFERKTFLVEPPRRRGVAAEEPAAPAVAPALRPGATPEETLQHLLELQARINATVQTLLRACDAPAAPMEAGGATDGVSSGAAAAETTSPEAGAPAEPAPAAGSDEPAEPPPPDPSGTPADAEVPATVPRWPVPEPGAPVPTLDDQRAYWRGRLAEPLPVLDLMPDSPRSPERTTQRSTLGARLDPSTLTAVDALAGDTEASRFAVFLAAYLGVLRRATGQDEFLVGALRRRPESSDATTLPLRLRVGDGSFRDLVGRVEAVARAAWAHGDVPFADLIQEVGRPDDPTRASVVQTRFELAGFPSEAGSAFDFGVVRVATDLDLRVEERGEGAVGLSLEYAAGLYRPETMKGLLARYAEFLTLVLASPDIEIEALPAADTATLQRMQRWNATTRSLPGTDGLADWLTEAWPAAADRTAVVAGGESLTYAELESRSNRLAHHLIAAGVTPGSLVGICLERTLDLPTAALAIWKAGAGYVPLDPTYPSARLGLMARRADLDLVVGTASLRSRVADYTGRWILLDSDGDAVAERSARRPEVETALSDPAYVLFTSGSTGEPKGVRVPARCVLNFLDAMSRRPGLTSDDVLLAVTTLSFDISVLELFLPLRVGGTSIVAAAEEAMDGAALAGLMERHGVSVLQATPSSWRLLLAAGWPGRRGLRALCGGEAFPRDLLSELLPRVAEVWNMYGPTETTVWSTCARLTDADAPVVIGSPIDNTRCHVLDAGGRPVGPGVPGELHIAGSGVADGYVGRPEETARRFVPDPFAQDGGRMYRTGDVVRWRRDGTLEHLHRVDQQVKVRGFRIELGEVEAALGTIDHVGAVAVVLADIDGSAELVGHAVADPTDWDERSVRARLAERLPPYMVPRFLLRVDEMPLTANGKIDRKALPDPSGGSAVGGSADDLAPPETEGEIYLHGLWQEVLELSAVSIHDNFFDLGGHSLLAVRTMVRIRQERAVDVPLRAFMAGTLRTVAAQYLSGDGPGREPATDDGGDASGTVARVLGTVREWISP